MVHEEEKESKARPALRPKCSLDALSPEAFEQLMTPPEPGIEKPWDEEDGIGVLHCCGRQLDWRHERGSRVLEAECGECGTRYLMGNDGGLDEVREFAM